MQVMKDADILIVDEASQAIQTETLLPLTYNPNKILLVGDTKQLPALVLSQAAKKQYFDNSLMRRLINVLKQAYCMLTIQHRMHPSIRQWPSKQFYGDKIENAALIKKRADLFDTKHISALNAKPYWSRCLSLSAINTNFLNYRARRVINIED